MKVSQRDIGHFIIKPQPHIQVILVHGQDIGLVHERIQKIARNIVDDLADPFRVSELTGKQIRDDPARLIEEAMAHSLGGGQRVIFVRLGTENISDGLKNLFEEQRTDTLVLLEAGKMTNASPVRKLLEKEDKAAVLACYGDNQASLDNLISEMFEQTSLRASREARNYLLAHLGSDRLVSRRELEKLILYAGDNADVSLEDVAEIVGDSGVLSIEEIVFAVASGHRDTLDLEFDRASAEGLSPISLLRATQRHINRLLLASTACAKGMSPAEAIKTLQPPVLFMFSEQFRHHLRNWSPSLLAKALSLLTEAELQCKSTGMPDRAIAERALLRVAQMAIKR